MAPCADKSYSTHKIGRNSNRRCYAKSLSAADTAFSSQLAEGTELKEIERGKVYFIGAGPGDPELITVRGAAIIQAADLIVYAGSLVPRLLLDRSRKEAQIHDSSNLSLEQSHALMTEFARKNKIVARVHTGDPALYGAIQEQIELLNSEGIPFEVVPGVTVAFAAAAALGRQLTQPGGSQNPHPACWPDCGSRERESSRTFQAPGESGGLP